MRTSINGTTRFATALNSGERYFKAYATITLQGTLPQGQQRTYSLDNTDIMQNGVKLEQSTSETNKFTVGSFILDKLTLTLYNDDGRFNDPIFTDADVELIISLDGLSKNDGVRIGRFVVTDVNGRNTSLLTLTCMDYGQKLNKVYVHSSVFNGLATTAKAIDIVNDCLTQCGVTAVSNFSAQFLAPNEEYPNPEDGEITCGQIISAIAQLNCRYVKFDSDGKLNFKWYHTAVDATVNDLFGFKYSEELYYTGIKLKTDARYYSGTTASNGQKNYETQPYVSTNGTADYMYVIENNPLLQIKLNNAGSNVLALDYSDTAMTRIWNALSTNRFTPVTLNALWNPLVEVGDTISTNLRIGGSKRTVTTMINNLSWTVGGQAVYSCEAEIPSRNVSQSMSATSIVERQLKKILQQRVDDFRNAYNNMLSDIASATGFHVTEIQQSGGTVIQYYHNGNADVDRDEFGNIIYNEYFDEDTGISRSEPSFSTATFLIKHAGTVIAASTDHGETWNWAINVDGNFIAQQIAAHKLIADDALIGNLTIRKYDQEFAQLNEIDDNPVMMQATIPYMDDDGVNHPGRFLLNADQVAITSNLNSSDTKTLQEAFDETAKVWFGGAVPTDTNYPAKDWANAERTSHVGDVYINTVTGKQYRYTKKYGCVKVTFDSDSELINSTVNNVKDYVRFYYQSTNGQWYRSPDYSGCDNKNEIAGKEFYCASNYLYMYSITNSLTKYEDDRKVTGFAFTVGNTKLMRGLNYQMVDGLPGSVNNTVTYSSFRTSRTSSDAAQFGSTLSKIDRKDSRYFSSSTRLYKIQIIDDTTWNSTYKDAEEYSWEEIDNWDLNTPSKILEKLTDGFRMEGIYMQNGKLYINMSYLRSGAIQIEDNGTEILFAGYDSTKQKNVLRMKADEFSLLAGTQYKDLDSVLQDGYFNQSKLIEALNGGALAQGLYAENGQLYISFNYARGGILSLGGAITSGDASTESADALTYKNGKLMMYSANSNLVGSWAGSFITQYREQTSSEYKKAYIERFWRYTRMILQTSSGGNTALFVDYHALQYNSSGTYVGDNIPYWNDSYKYWSMRVQGGEGYRLVASKLQIMGKYTQYAGTTLVRETNAYSADKIVDFDVDNRQLVLNLLTHTVNATNLYTIKSGNYDIRLTATTYSKPTSTVVSVETFSNSGSSTQYYRFYTGQYWRFGYETVFSGGISVNDKSYFNGFTDFNSSTTFYVAPKLYNLTHVTSGGHLVFASDGLTLSYLSESTKRIKDIDRPLVAEDLQNIYGISVYRAKYKDGYLAEDDQRNGKYFPMFIAEDVQEFFPDAVDLDVEGNAKDWNHRVMIPAMFQLVKSQKEEITALQNKVNSLEDRLKKLEKLLLNES